MEKERAPAYAEKALTFDSRVELIFPGELEERWEIFRLLSRFQCFDPNCYDHNGDTPLIICSRDANSLETIRLLTSHPKIDINFRNFRDQSAFTIAGMREKEEIMRFLASCPGFDPEKSNAVLALAQAIMLRTTTQVPFILSLDFDVNRAFVMKGGLAKHYSRAWEVLADMGTRTVSTAIRVAMRDGDRASAAWIVAHPRFDAEMHGLTDVQCQEFHRTSHQFRGFSGCAAKFFGDGV
jgi:hypothetical protein